MAFGLGFEILQSPGRAGEYGSIGRFGWGGAYGTSYEVDPVDDLVVVLMLQALPRRNLDIADKFRTMVYAALIPPTPTQGQ